MERKIVSVNFVRATKAPDHEGNVLIIGKSTSPVSRRNSGQTPGAVTVGQVDSEDFGFTSRRCGFPEAQRAREKSRNFAGSVR